MSIKLLCTTMHISKMRTSVMVHNLRTMMGTLTFCIFMISKTTAQHSETKLGWKLGAQAYTFNRFTFFQAIHKIDSCDLTYVEGFPGQDIGGGIEGKLDYHMSEFKRNQILQRLKENGITLQTYGVVSANSDSDWRQLFEFCKSMGIGTITSEPNDKDIPLLSKLCEEYQINVAIHNHPQPNRYWHPDAVLAALKGQSKRIGACADIGHWVRSGLDPVECLKKLEGRVFHLHMKDLNEKNNKKAHDVHWGQGVSNIDGVIQELKRQNFKGMISIEYEYNWDNNAPDVAASIGYFRKAIKR